MREKQLTQKGFLVIDLRKDGTFDPLNFALTEREADALIFSHNTFSVKGRFCKMVAVPATVTFELP